MTDLSLYINSNFEGVDKDGLKQLAKGAGLKTPPNPGEEWLRTALRNHHAGVAPPATAVTAAPESMPNLTPFGAWGGRCRRVVVTNNSGDATLKGITVHWEGRPQDFLFNVERTVGEPWFNIMKQQKKTLTVCRTVTEADGSKRVVPEDMSVPAISFQDLGPDPATEHLPGSLLEYYRRLAKNTTPERQNFAKYTRRALLRILSELRPEIGENKTKDMQSGDLRYLILQFLGPDFAMTESDEEPEEVAA